MLCRLRANNLERAKTLIYEYASEGISDFLELIQLTGGLLGMISCSENNKKNCVRALEELQNALTQQVGDKLQQAIGRQLKIDTTAPTISPLEDEEARKSLSQHANEYARYCSSLCDRVNVQLEHLLDSEVPVAQEAKLKLADIRSLVTKVTSSIAACVADRTELQS